MIKLMITPALAAASPRFVDSLRATRKMYCPAREMNVMGG
jgi:hypothetical protein